MNDSRLSHPGPERLSAFGSGQLEESELAEISAHLAVCEACRVLVESTPEDSLISLPRASAKARAVAAADAAAESRDMHEARTCTQEPEASSLPDAVPPGLANHSRYRVLELVGVGGMGAVYKAEHRLMERLVALKVIRPNLLARAGAVER